MLRESGAPSNRCAGLFRSNASTSNGDYWVARSSRAMTKEGTHGLVLAGGLARRMGGRDKALIRIGRETILERALARLAPQVSGIVLNANGDPARFASFGLPVVADSVPDFAGPLAGILAGLDWVAANRPDIAWVASVPGDCPFL